MPIWSLLAQSQPNETTQFIDRVARTPISMILIVAAVATMLRIIVFPMLMNTPVHKRSGAFAIAKFVNEATDALVYAAIVVFMLVRPFGIQTFTIPSGSMIDTLHVRDYIVANKWVYRVSEPQVGDIVVFKPPVWARENPAADQDFIKRLVGRPGDLIEIKDEKLYRNGKAIEEPYYTKTDFHGESVVPKDRWADYPIPDFKLVEKDGQVMPLQYKDGSANSDTSITRVYPKYTISDQDEMDKLIAQPAVRIPQGYYLFMGDNRNGSADGRFWGLVPRDQIVGKAWFVWLPLSRAKLVDKAPVESTVH